MQEEEHVLGTDVFTKASSTILLLHGSVMPGTSYWKSLWASQALTEWKRRVLFCWCILWIIQHLFFQAKQNLIVFWQEAE